MINNIPLSNESVFKIKTFHYLDLFLLTPLRIIWNIVLLLIECLLCASLKIWNHIYNSLYEKRKYLTKVVLKLLSLIEAVILIIFSVQYWGFKTFIPSLLWWMGGLAGGVAVVYFILWLYFIFIGRDTIIQQNILYTDKYVEECMPPMIKIYGPPRVGKDTTGISMTSILCRRNRRLIPKIMARIRKIAYVFDWILVNDICNVEQNKFMSSSKDTRRNNFIDLCQRVQFKAFLKQKFLEKIDYQEFVEDYKNSLDNKVDYESKWLYNDGISKRHMLDLLNDYMYLYVRLYIVKNFSLVNQPYIEDPETGLTGKRYSVLFEASASADPVTKEPKDIPDLDVKQLKDVVINIDKKGKMKIEFKEKIMAPITDWTVINLTEFDTWMRNTDSEVKALIKTYNLRDSKALYGHYYNMLTYIQICHEALRTNAQLRGLDDFYLNVLQRVEFPGASKRNAFLSGIQSITDYFVAKGNVKLDDANNTIFYKSQKKIDYYQRLYNASGNDKYLGLIQKLEEAEFKETSRFTDIMSKWNKWLLERIEQNKREHGAIRITATISDQPNAPNLKTITMKELIKRDTPLFHEAYKVDFYFRMKDSMGRYNHQYMSPVLENRAAQSVINFGNVMNWEKRMELTEQAMLEMGFPAGRKLYGITADEDFKFRYVSFK